MSFEFHLPSLEEMRATPDGVEMLRMIDDDNFRSALITGCPGSGKTTVSIYRLVRINSQHANVHLVTYQKLLALAIQNLVSSQRVSSQCVSTFQQWYWRITKTFFDVDASPTPDEMDNCLQNSQLANQQITEMLIDEGQDLPICVYETLPRHFARIFIGADDGQQVHQKHGARVDDIKAALRTNFVPFTPFILGRNFRNTYETYAFARQFIPKTNQNAWDQTILDRLLRSNRHGPKPTVISYQNEDMRNAHLKMTLQNADGNVAILCPRIDSVDEIHEMIIQMGFSATKYHSRTDLPDTLERYVVTTFKSAKGMEFDVVVVPCINYDKPINEQWYVACTRARRQLFVYRDFNDPQCDPTLAFDVNTYEAESAESAESLDPAAGQELPF